MSVAAGRRVRTGAKESTASWPLIDRIGLWCAWTAGMLLCGVMLAVIGYMAYRGIQYLRPSLLVTRPSTDVDQTKSGGILDAIGGTIILTTMAICIAVPLGTTIAVWLTEYGRPAWLARLVESGVEIIAGTPSIVLAIFGLLIFQQSFFGFLSFTAQGGGVFGRSFFTCAPVMSLIALPLIVGSTREALNTIPRHVREASYALGKTRAATIWKVLVPASRPGIATGAALGMGRIAGDTAIVLILLGGTLRLEGQGGLPGLSTLRGTGSTLTTYVYGNSPAGEGNAYQKAYAAAFVLLLLIIGLNALVDLIARGRRAAPEWIR